ncbi:MAG: M48 family metallopeptidase [Pseudomonadales bacterium]
MDFFGAQDDARRKTWRLTALFVAAVASLILLTNLLIASVYAWSANYARPQGYEISGSLAAMPGEYWALITLAVVGVIALASLYKYVAVRGGGRAIAESLGGTLLHQASADPKQRRLLNVVEEMAIASGLPVPPVYLIPEPSINAFAAGFTPSDAVIGVNQGTIDHLSRDELQGVIGHEFSHILNGDMRLNLRLIAALFGILFIGLVGRGILNGLGRSGVGRRSRGSGGTSAGVPVLALGVGLLVIGYAGTFFGNLIKAAVSRQREYLADAAAVQFTRNPQGIAGALKKIGGLSAGSAMPGAAAGEASHMFFGQARQLFLNSLTATHPPLEKRIRAIDPGWDGQFPLLATEVEQIRAARAAGPDAAPAFADVPAAQAVPDTALEVATAPAGVTTSSSSPDALAGAVGRLDAGGLAQARQLIRATSEPLREAAHDPFAARALVYALLIDSDPALRGKQLEQLESSAEVGIRREAARLLPLLEGISEAQQLTLIEMAIPALKALSDAQYRRFVDNMVTLITMDRRIDLMEWTLHRLLLKDLKPHFEKSARPHGRLRNLQSLGPAAATLLSALARESAGPDQGRSAFAAGRAELGLDITRESDPDENYQRLNEALRQLRAVKPLQKPRLIKACAAAVLADGVLEPRAAALLRGIAAALDCPLPPTVLDAPQGEA